MGGGSWKLVNFIPALHYVGPIFYWPGDDIAENKLDDAAYQEAAMAGLLPTYP